MPSLWNLLPLLVLGLWLLQQGGQRLSHKLAQRDRLPAAAACMALSLLCWPFSAAHWTRLGNILGDLGLWAQARTCFGLALKLRPNWIEAHLGAGTAALVQNEEPDNSWSTAEAHLLRAYCLRRGTPWNLKHLDPGEQAQTEDSLFSPELQAAWQQQLKWLNEEKLLPAPVLQTALVEPRPERSLYLERPEYAGNPLQNCDRDAIVQAYRQSPGLAWYDDFLQPDALNALLDFCQRSTFWHHRYQNAYLGAYLDDGFTCPLLYQIAGALQQQLPELLGDLHLVYMWAFKCHHRGRGVALHHDSAVVNVNFWLTPDSANCDPNSGGLCVYTEEPPEFWDLERYAVTGHDMQEFIERRQATRHCIAYRQNRVVIFNSRLFHETQDFHFQAGYAQQRINVTLLFGKAPLRYHPKLPLPAKIWQAAF